VIDSGVLVKILLVASTGGHLAQLLNVRGCWEDQEVRWVTFRKPAAEAALAGETVSWAYHPVTRNIPNAIRNLGLALRLFRRWRPDVVVSTGAGVAVPFFLAARWYGARTLYIEAFERIDRPALTGVLCYPFADRFCVQWEEQLRMYPEAVNVGSAW
jgi:UDP-N-acetylglucosamine:LPS N-acetylglucosamine transferase